MQIPEGTQSVLPHHHVVGLGAGPANLSLAALGANTVPGGVALFERREGPAWHPGLLRTGTQLQTSWIKDLVSLADPCNPLSFLNYLVSTGRIYAFLNAQYDAIPRLEYARYLAWASAQLGTVNYGTEVAEVDFSGGRFVVSSASGPLATADHVVFGLGTRPEVPACFEGLGAGGAILAEHLEAHLSTVSSLPYEQVIVVGGGQTGAECVLHLMQRGFRDIRWIGRRQWFAPMDDSPSANDFYRPTYLRFFQGLPEDIRARYVGEQTLTSDGVSMVTLQQLYQANYEAFLSEGRSPVMMLPGRNVVEVAERHGSIALWCERDWGGRERHAARFVVLATGRRQAALPISSRLAGLMELDAGDEPVIDSDYSLRWKHAETNRMYVQNRSRVGHGLADPNLSLLAVRSAVILNSVLERQAFAIRDEQMNTVWA
ncbi:SidA/IucD/PvdA family monooxygenase [Streptacidiphilus sp. PB12-B1b]|uniref:lysine N(6)-hydroxylase/L-ornithine N(5)-oxygenase family protein n=1 Tax=Streptacidiphilus sp. PB12-B1b TaxID=2705012 RepID=UPI0015FA352A|nr:SidA/IucD/PvdA family monooxygenase [Streptacidiphilus sp. PB12-B1b]QMU78157.1 SidA/IucD/PvdA family monooxygenase [Streptacidiphilus sp. PB12-B1b]